MTWGRIRIRNKWDKEGSGWGGAMRNYQDEKEYIRWSWLKIRGERWFKKKLIRLRKL